MKTLNTLAAIQLSQVINQLTDLADYELIAIHNDYCEVNNDSYNHIIDNDNEAIDSMFDSPSEAIRAAIFGDYHSSHNYFILDGYANLVSFNYASDDNCPIDISELAQWLIDEDKLGEYDITVTTLDDMLASIEDNITDDEMLLNTVCKYLHLNHITLGNEYSFDEKVNIVLELINGFNYEQLNKLITDLNINYQ